MSKLHKAVLGIPRGILGHLSFRVRKGVPLITTRPIPFMPGKEPADYARRSRFGLTCRFSAVVNSIEKLKKLWTPLATAGSSFNRITQTNYGYISDTAVSNSAAITPDKGLGLPITSAVVTNTEIQIEIDSLLTEKINASVETKIRLAGVLYLSGPKSENTPATRFIPVVSQAQDLDIQAPTIFTIELDSQDTMVFDAYNNHKFFYAALTEDENGKVYHYSKTCSA